jgi:hypothetical protein
MTEQNDVYDEFSNFMALLKKAKLFENITNNIDSAIEKPIKVENKNKTEENFIKKLKCSICKVKINSVDAIISSCKCNKNHCLKHRLPESHKCDKIQEKCEEEKKNLEKNLIKVVGSKLSTI